MVSMGVRIPPQTRLPASTLRQRIVKGLDLAQMLTELFGEGRGPNFETLQVWKQDECLFHGMSHFTREEIEKWKEHIGPFDSIRRLIAAIAKTVDIGSDAYLTFWEYEGNRFIRLKVREVSLMGSLSFK